MNFLLSLSTSAEVLDYLQASYHFLSCRPFPLCLAFPISCPDHSCRLLESSPYLSDLSLSPSPHFFQLPDAMQIGVSPGGCSFVRARVRFFCRESLSVLKWRGATVQRCHLTSPERHITRQRARQHAAFLRPGKSTMPCHSCTCRLAGVHFQFFSTRHFFERRGTFLTPVFFYVLLGFLLWWIRRCEGLCSKGPSHGEAEGVEGGGDRLGAGAGA